MAPGETELYSKCEGLPYIRGIQYFFPAGSGTPAGSRFIPVAKLGAKVVKSRKMGPLFFFPRLEPYRAWKDHSNTWFPTSDFFPEVGNTSKVIAQAKHV